MVNASLLALTPTRDRHCQSRVFSLPYTFNCNLLQMPTTLKVGSTHALC